MKKIIIAASLFLFCGYVFANNVTSQYSPLSGKQCSKIDDYSMQCPGVAGYRLNVLDDDNRMSIDVIYPDKKKYELNLWGVVTRGFSHLGKVAEWRIAQIKGKATPQAMIVRVYQDASEGARARSFLAIIKLAPKEACVTEVLNGNLRMANSVARIKADQALNKACLPE
jgi:hypothetical protein